MPVQEPSNLVIHDPQRAHHLLMLEFGSRTQFDDPKLEYRRLFSELLGTFMLVLVAAGGGILHGQGQISLTAAVVAPGLMVLAIILFMGAVSGAHLNPAVSLAFAVRGDFPWKRVPGYIITSCSARRWRACSCSPYSATSTTLGRRCRDPVTTTAGLPDGDRADGVRLSVILGTASAAQNVGAIGALGVGGYIALAGLGRRRSAAPR